MRGTEGFRWSGRGARTGRAERRWVLAVLDDIAEGRSSTGAKRHPLGFVCLPLERRGHQGVCVHVWSEHLPRARPTTSAVHAHSWELTSRVLYGSMRNEVFAITDAPATDAPGPATHRVFEIRSEGELDEVRATSRLVSCQVAAVEVNDEGEGYAVPAGVFHATVVDGEAATLALGIPRPGTRDLSLGGIDTPTHRVARHRCDRDETVAAARIVVQRLADEEDRWRP